MDFEWSVSELPLAYLLASWHGIVSDKCWCFCVNSQASYFPVSDSTSEDITVSHRKKENVVKALHHGLHRDDSKMFRKCSSDFMILYHVAKEVPRMPESWTGALKRRCITLSLSKTDMRAHVNWSWSWLLSLTGNVQLGDLRKWMLITNHT